MRGFTLIEAIMYIALLGLIMSGAVVTAFQLLNGAGSINAENTAEEEGTFVLRKIDWALSSVSSFSIPTSHELIVTRYDGMIADIKTNGAEVDMKTKWGFVPLTTNNVMVTSLTFTDIPAIPPGPEGVTATLVLNGLTFSTTKYLRK